MRARVFHTVVSAMREVRFQLLAIHSIAIVHERNAFRWLRLLLYHAKVATHSSPFTLRPVGRHRIGSNSVRLAPSFRNGIDTRRAVAMSNHSARMIANHFL
jgi:hypothetical protein